MHAMLTTLERGQFVVRDLGNIPSHSFEAIRDALTVRACRLFGQDWRYVYRRDYLVPVYIASNKTGDTIEAE